MQAKKAQKEALSIEKVLLQVPSFDYAFHLVSRLQMPALPLQARTSTFGALCYSYSPAVPISLTRSQFESGGQSSSPHYYRQAVLCPDGLRKGRLSSVPVPLRTGGDSSNSEYF